MYFRIYQFELFCTLKLSFDKIRIVGSIFHIAGSWMFMNKTVEGHLWKAQWKEKPNDEGHKKLPTNS